MDAGLKQKWVKALRSGKYEQARGCLKSNNAFCCLGVLADLVGVKFDKFDYPKLHGWDGNYNTLLPIDEPTSVVLYEKNDGVGQHEHSFDEIADFIEANL